MNKEIKHTSFYPKSFITDNDNDTELVKMEITISKEPMEDVNCSNCKKIIGRTTNNKNIIGTQFACEYCNSFKPQKPMEWEMNIFREFILKFGHINFGKFDSDKWETQDILDFISSQIKQAEKRERERIVKEIEKNDGCLYSGDVNYIINLIKNNNMTTEEKIIEDWEKAFDKKFTNNGETWCGDRFKPIHFKQFIKFLLQQYRKEVEHCDEPNCPECNLVAYNKGKADMLEEVKEKIEERKNEAREILNKSPKNFSAMGAIAGLEDLLQTLTK